MVKRSSKSIVVPPTQEGHEPTDLDHPKNLKNMRARVLAGPVFQKTGGSDYEINDRYVEARNPFEAHTVHELVKYLEENKTFDIDARILSMENETGNLYRTRLNKTQFLQTFKDQSKAGPAKLAESRVRKKRFKENWDNDCGFFNGYLGDAIGRDFTPLLGGPFNKQLYIYDYLRMHSAAFFAYNHCPMSKSAVDMTGNFTLGRGFRIDIDNPKGLALWRAFEEVNEYEAHMEMFAQELSEYGESMTWFLPNMQIYNYYSRRDSNAAALMPRGLIPRIKLMDPSTIWEITTLPEDISRVISYTQNFPTQYQIYTGKDPSTKEKVPTAKFIFQQIPASEVIHTKVNCASDEKRGRSDLFPVLGYSKRLRDSVNYEIVKLQKNAAWAIDTEVDGDQDDIDAYLQSVASSSGIVPAGSEFVHSKYIKRNYFGATGGGGGKGGNVAFDWTMSMFASGVGFPMEYFGTHLSGGKSRATAVVASEPIAKKLEKRQRVYERKIKKDIAKYFEIIGFKEDYIAEVSFPAIITQDAAITIKNIDMAKTGKYISQERAANMIAKELNVTEFDWATEKQAIMNEEAESIDAPINPLQDELVNDLATALKGPSPSAPSTEAPTEGERPSPQGMSGDERGDAKDAGIRKT